MMVKISLILIFLGFNHAMSVDEYLDLKIIDSDIEKNHLVSKIKGASFGEHYWDDFSFRYELNGFEGDRHDFQLRWKPANWGEVNAEQKLANLNQKKYEYQANRIHQKNYEKKYDEILKWKKIELRQLKNNQRKSLNTEKRKWLESQIGSKSFNPGLWIEMEREKMSLGRDSLEIKNQEEILYQSAERMFGKRIKPDLETIHWIDVSEIKKYAKIVLEKNNELEFKHHQKISELELKRKLAEYKENAWLDFIKLGYEMHIPKDADERYSIHQKYWSLGVGINFPFWKGNGKDQISRKLNVEFEKLDFKEETNQWQERRNKKKQGLENAFVEFDLLNEFYTKAKENNWYTLYKDYAQENPQVMMDVFEAELKIKHDIKEQYNKILEEYIDLLKIDNLLDLRLDKNFLETLP